MPVRFFRVPNKYFLLILYFFYGARVSVALTIDEFFPFGTLNGDTRLVNSNGLQSDDVSANVQFVRNFRFYGQSYSFFAVRDYN